MMVAWCRTHHGVMRLSFCDVPYPHFTDRCPRCGAEVTVSEYVPFPKGK